MKDDMTGYEHLCGLVFSTFLFGFVSRACLGKSSIETQDEPFSRT
jgi:hypothetical protein